MALFASSSRSPQTRFLTAKALRLRAPGRPLDLALNSRPRRSLSRSSTLRKNRAARAVEMIAIARAASFTHSDEIHSADPGESVYVPANKTSRGLHIAASLFGLIGLLELG